MLNPASVGRIDIARLRSTPNTQVQAKSVLGDTLHARGDGPPMKAGQVGAEVQVVFRASPGPFTNMSAFNA